jgi:hypothetical protein
MGLVKNRAKSGQFYWVNAYVTPILNDRSRSSNTSLSAPVPRITTSPGQSSSMPGSVTARHCPG